MNVNKISLTSKQGNVNFGEIDRLSYTKGTNSTRPVNSYKIEEGVARIDNTLNYLGLLNKLLIQTRDEMIRMQ